MIDAVLIFNLKDKKFFKFPEGMTKSRRKAAFYGRQYAERQVSYWPDTLSIMELTPDEAQAAKDKAA